MAIPSNIHTVWFGHLLRNDFKTNAIEWKRLYPDWQIYLWTDSASFYSFPMLDPDKDKRIFDSAQLLFPRVRISQKQSKQHTPYRNPNITSSNSPSYPHTYVDLKIFCDANKITLKDINDPNVRKELCDIPNDNNADHESYNHETIVNNAFALLNYELNNATSNPSPPGSPLQSSPLKYYEGYASASDILRLIVLIIMGGIYTDLDNKPKEKIPDQILNRKNFFMPALYYFHSGIYDKLQFRGNSFIASTPRFYFLYECLKTIINNYSGMQANEMNREFRKTQPGIQDIRDTRFKHIIETTGPHILAQTLERIKMAVRLKDESKVKTLPGKEDTISELISFVNHPSERDFEYYVKINSAKSWFNEDILSPIFCP